VEKETQACVSLLALIVAVLFLATGTAHAGGHWYQERWTCTLRWVSDDPEWAEAGPNPATIKIEDIPAMLERFKNMKKWSAWTQCLEDRAAGKVKHCYENDRRWR
jgi:hypothetical protein